MKIDGKAIAQTILDNLSKRVKELKKRGVNPYLVIILIGDDPASAAYVQQKELKAKEIGAKTTTLKLPLNITSAKLLKLLIKLNTDQEVNGIIVQRPLPSQIDHETVAAAVDPKKDVDGLHPQSLYPMPLAAAVLRILKEIYTQSGSDLAKAKKAKSSVTGSDLVQWLRTQNVIVIGKGRTGGGPVIDMLRKRGLEPLVIDSRTMNPKLITKDSTIIITSVGKSNIVTKEMIKKGVILISVGLHRGEDNKLHGDYEEDEVKNIAAYYTPTPGGVGPVNVAMLLANLVEATEKLTSQSH